RAAQTVRRIARQRRRRAVARREPRRPALAFNPATGALGSHVPAARVPDGRCLRGKLCDAAVLCRFRRRPAGGERRGQPAARGWQEFTLYRAAPAAGSLTVTLAMSGLGEAFVDDLTVRVVNLPPSGTVAADGRWTPAGPALPVR